MKFLPYKNSLLFDLCSNKKPQSFKSKERNKSILPASVPKNLSLISGLYIYTNTPPHGYGTQAPKVAETINRAYSFNLKKQGKTIQILGRTIERMQWEKQDGAFPFNEIHGNFIPSETRMMVENFLLTNQPYIDSCADNIMKKMLETNSDILTKGRQTFCPFTNQSVTSAVAYQRMYEFFTENTGMQCISCLEWLQAFFILFDKPSIKYTTSAWVEVNRKVYNKTTKQRVLVKAKIKQRKTITTETVEGTRETMITLATRFASYIKHKERGKKDRRAIASAGMILRMFLLIIEEFHLELSKKVEGATISIGGEEKKQKITSNMSSASLPSGPASVISQGTEDATKWNECLSPAVFALMHKYFFDGLTRTRLCLPPATEMGTLFSMIAVAGNFLMSMKEIQLGKGLMVYSDSEYSRLEWSREWYNCMNSVTKQWFNDIEDKITEDREYVKASPGMLMGMLNAGSTTVGLLAPNHRMDRNQMKVLTLRSSDDSMSLYMGMTAERNKECIEKNRRNLCMLGINLSPDKTFIFHHGLGEYTSWYMDGSFVSQFGTETSSIRPKGINPHDDFYSVAKETSTSLSTLTINHVGASARLRLGIDNARRLWRIKREEGKRQGISSNVQLLSDGGGQPWNCTNCHLEEISLRELKSTTEEERNYLLRIQNPENPFSQEPVEEMSYSKEHGTLTLNLIETPRTCFNYVKKSNRTLERKEKEEEAKKERMNHEAAKLINLVDPTTLVTYPSTRSSIASHLSSILKLESDSLQLDETQKKLLDDAISVLDEGRTDKLFATIKDEMDEEYNMEMEEEAEY